MIEPPLQATWVSVWACLSVIVANIFSSQVFRSKFCVWKALKRETPKNQHSAFMLMSVTKQTSVKYLSSYPYTIANYSNFWDIVIFSKVLFFNFYKETKFLLSLQNLRSSTSLSLVCPFRIPSPSHFLLAICENFWILYEIFCGIGSLVLCFLRPHVQICMDL